LSIVTEQSIWYLFFCLLAGGVYAYVLYFWGNNEFSPKLKRLLAALRFVAVSLIAFLLLSPLLKTISNTIEKPIIVLAQDNSQSIIINKDSSFYKTEYHQQLADFVKQMSNDYDIKTLTFGSGINNQLAGNFDEKESNMAQLFDELMSRYANRNIGALIFASDGIYNKGTSPVYASEKFKYPVYTIALGDTNVQRDIILTKVNYNQVVFRGNTFPVEVIINVNKFNGKKTQLTLSKGKQVLTTKTVSFTSDQFATTVTLQLEAKESGLQHYHLNLSPLPGEISKKNNATDIFVEVIDDRQKILILANSPHPDISAIKQSLESNINFQVESSYINEFNQPLDKYNLVILHQLPSTTNSATSLLSKLKQANIPVLYILGSQSDIFAFNRLKKGINILTAKMSLNESLPAINNEFSLFGIDNDDKKLFDIFPPLISPFGDYKQSNATHALFFQKIGKVTTQQPLIAFNQDTDIKTGIIAGEGIWRWRIADYQHNSNHAGFDKLINKIAQFLTVKADRSFFRINGKNHFFETEPIELEAEVYNQSYELINQPEVSLSITDEKNKNYNFAFTKTTNAYYLNAGVFPAGNYKYSARVKLNNKILQKNGMFTVVPLNLEAINTVADHNLMYRLAKNHDGEMVYPRQLDKLVKMLKARDDIKNVSYTQKRLTGLNNIFWVLVLIIVLLGTEWFLRKYNGSY